MAATVFTIVELRQEGAVQVETPNRFAWDVDNRAAPRDAWEFGIEVRTVREDYPGVDEPTEQILGANYKPFEVSGVWDDRYAGAGFAEATRRAIESLAARTPVVRVQLEQVSVTCVFKGADFKYRRAALIEYTLHFSPHYREKGAFRRVVAAPQSLKSPKEMAQAVRLPTDAAVEHQETDAPQSVLTEDLFGTVDETIRALEAGLDTVDELVAALATPVEGSVAVVERIAQGFADARGRGAAVLAELATVRSDTDLAFETAAAVLSFELWRGGVSYQARRTILAADEGARELARRATPAALAMYTPRAGESLYGISNRFYGTPHGAAAIARANNLSVFTLSGTELLVIPERR